MSRDILEDLETLPDEQADRLDKIFASLPPSEPVNRSVKPTCRERLRSTRPAMAPLISRPGE
ncbi:MAG: hypothetical protein WCS65_02425 [Verrucomicrobiae bacterium]